MKSKRRARGESRPGGRASAIERGERFANDMTLGFKALELVVHSTAGFPGLESGLRRLERLLVAIQSGELTSNVPVSERTIEQLRELRVLIGPWLRTGEGTERLRLLSKKTLRNLSRLPRLPRGHWCVLCQERPVTLRGTAGGVCRECILNASRALGAPR